MYVYAIYLFFDFLKTPVRSLYYYDCKLLLLTNFRVTKNSSDKMISNYKLTKYEHGGKN